MTKLQGWIIIGELAILLAGLYYAGQQVQAETASIKSSPLASVVSGIENLFGSGQPAQGTTPII